MLVQEFVSLVGQGKNKDKENSSEHQTHKNVLETNTCIEKYVKKIRRISFLKYLQQWSELPNKVDLNRLDNTRQMRQQPTRKQVS